jgi:hypothetical protein
MSRLNDQTERGISTWQFIGANCRKRFEDEIRREHASYRREYCAPCLAADGSILEVLINVVVSYWAICKEIAQQHYRNNDNYQDDQQQNISPEAMLIEIYRVGIDAIDKVAFRGANDALVAHARTS